MKAVIIMYISTDLRAPRHKRASTNKQTNKTKHNKKKPSTSKMQRTLQNEEGCKSQITKKTAVESLRNDTEGYIHEVSTISLPK